MPLITPQPIPEVIRKNSYNNLANLFKRAGLTIVKRAFQSDNFVIGSAGWQFTAEGNLEGNSGTFRGALIANSIDIPDTTTANSFHTDNLGNSWWGATTFATAVASISKAGAIVATSITITGGSISGVPISSIPNSTATDISLLEKTHNLVFSVTDADTIAWAAGTIVFSNGRTFTISGGNTGNMAALTYIYLDTAISLTALQTTTTYSTAMGANKSLIGMAQNNTVTAMFIPYGAGQPLIDGANIGALSIVAENIAASTITANKLSVSTLSAITADLGIITAGSITLNTVNAVTINYGGNIIFKEGGDIRFASVTAPTACTATLIATATGNVNNGTHKYKITFVNASGETNLGSVSNTVTVDASNKQVALSSIPLSSSNSVTARKIYRTKAGGTGYYLLTTISDNTTTSYTDNTADADLTGSIGDTFFNDRENDSFGRIFIDGIKSFGLGDTNTFVGQGAGNSISSGFSNTALGVHTLYANTTGYLNVAIGSGYGNGALYSNTTGYLNTAVGSSAGGSITTGNSNIFIGGTAGNNASQKVDVVNSIAIGEETYTTANNQIVIGNTSVVSTIIRGLLNITTKTPASAAASGIAGDIAWDASYIYVCTATDTWKRVAIATW